MLCMRTHEFWIHLSPLGHKHQDLKSSTPCRFSKTNGPRWPRNIARIQCFGNQSSRYLKIRNYSKRYQRRIRPLQTNNPVAYLHRASPINQYCCCSKRVRTSAHPKARLLQWMTIYNCKQRNRSTHVKVLRDKRSPNSVQPPGQCSSRHLDRRVVISCYLQFERWSCDKLPWQANSQSTARWCSSSDMQVAKQSLMKSDIRLGTDLESPLAPSPQGFRMRCCPHHASPYPAAVAVQSWTRCLVYPSWVL